MKKSNFTHYDELPLFLNAEIVAKLLGIGQASAYELMHEKDFPTIRIGKRLVVPKDKFLIWVNENTNGDGLVRKRGDSRWEGRIVAGHKKDGSPIYRAVFAEKQSELMPKLHQLKEQYAGVELTGDSSITLGEWLDKWMEEYKKPVLRRSTYSRYLGDIQNHIKPHLGAKKLLQLKTYDLQKFYNKLCESGNLRDKEKGLSSATVRGIHNILHDALDCAMKLGVIANTPKAKKSGRRIAKQAQGRPMGGSRRSQLR